MSIVWPTKLHSSLYFEWQARGELEQPLSHSHRGGESQYLPPFFFLFTIFFGRQQHEYLCPFTGPMECGNQPPTAVTSAEWKTLSSMTHRVRWHTSTGCLIVRLRSVSTWPERLSAVRWVEETLLPLIDPVGWLNTEEPRPRRKLVGQHARPILQSRWVCHRRCWWPLQCSKYTVTWVAFGGKERARMWASVCKCVFFVLLGLYFCC